MSYECINITQKFTKEEEDKILLGNIHPKKTGTATMLKKLYDEIVAECEKQNIPPATQSYVVDEPNSLVQAIVIVPDMNAKTVAVHMFLQMSIQGIRKKYGLPNPS